MSLPQLLQDSLHDQCVPKIQLRQDERSETKGDSRCHV